MTHTKKDWQKEFIEKAAALEHARWSRWHMYMLGKQTPENLERWARQCLTPYEGLSENEKESDRREVREYLPLISKLLAEQREEIIKVAEGMKKQVRYRGTGTPSQRALTHNAALSELIDRLSRK